MLDSSRYQICGLIRQASAKLSEGYASPREVQDLLLQTSSLVATLEQDDPPHGWVRTGTKVMSHEAILLAPMADYQFQFTVQQYCEPVMLLVEGLPCQETDTYRLKDVCVGLEHHGVTVFLKGHSTLPPGMMIYGLIINKTYIHLPVSLSLVINQLSPQETRAHV